MTKPPLTKTTVLVICLAPFLLPGLFVIGWTGRNIVTQFTPEGGAELLYSLMFSLLIAGAFSLAGVVFMVYTLTFRSRYAMQTLAVLGIASLVVGFVLYDAPLF